MRISSITVTYGRSLDLSKAGAAQLQVSLTAEADPGDDIRTDEDLRQVLDTLWHAARSSVREQGAALLAQRAT